MAFTLTGTKVEMENTLESTRQSRQLVKRAEASITATHDFSVGDIIVIDNVSGMNEINKKRLELKRYQRQFHLLLRV